MRTCPFTFCGKSIQETMFACKQHWYSLNKVQRDTIWDAYHAYTNGDISITALRAIQSQVLAEVQGDTPEQHIMRDLRDDA